MAKGVVLSPVVARKVKRLIDRDGEGNGRASSGGVAIDVSESAFPFAVNYSATLGAWLCYIPDCALIYIGSARYRLNRSELTAAGSPYPSGWFKIEGSSGGVAFLNFWYRSGDDALSCSLTRSEAADREGYQRYSYEIAALSERAGGVKYRVQLINSAIFVGGGAGKKIRGGEYTNLVVDDSDPEYTTIDVFYKRRDS